MSQLAPPEPPATTWSLTARLTKLWRERDWLAFIDLYYQERAQADQSPWRERLVDGLFNGLTFVLLERPERETIDALAKKLCQETIEPEPFIPYDRGVETETKRLHNCALIALSLTNEKLPEKFPSYLSVFHTPEPYRSLGLALLRAYLAPKKTPKNSSPVKETLKKLKKQFAKLPQSKTYPAYAAFLATATQLQVLLTKESDLLIAKNIVALAELLVSVIRKSATTSSYGLELIDQVSQRANFAALAKTPSHPAILTLWDLFCRLGQEKFGDEWAVGTRLLTLHFYPELDPTLAASMKKLIDFEPVKPRKKSLRTRKRELIFSSVNDQDNDDNMDDNIHDSPQNQLISFFLQHAHSPREEYVLKALLAHQPMFNDEPAPPQPLQEERLTHFSDLTVLGEQFRFGRAFWAPPILEAFHLYVKTHFSNQTLAHIASLSLPWSQFSDCFTLALAFLVPGLKLDAIKEAAGNIAQSPLSEKTRLEAIELITSRKTPLAQGWSNLASFLSAEDIALFYDDFVFKLIKNAANFQIDLGEFKINTPRQYWDMDEINSRDQKAGWSAFTTPFWEFGLERSHQGGLIKAFLEILIPSPYNAPPQSLTNNAKKLALFLRELRKNANFVATDFLILVLDWPNLESDFLDSLIDLALAQLGKMSDFTPLLLAVFAQESPLMESMSQRVLNRLKNFPRQSDHRQTIAQFTALVEGSTKLIKKIDLGTKRYFSHSTI
ncbi:MAG: hypothetical protein LBT86_05615 [Deltaproteobacteria bacterium]|jgi:hypothetical protein|nr:hypothetical protein [Deltaproteobacteria bacterium]